MGKCRVLQEGKVVFCFCVPAFLRGAYALVQYWSGCGCSELRELEIFNLVYCLHGPLLDKVSHYVPSVCLLCATEIRTETLPSIFYLATDKYMLSTRLLHQRPSSPTRSSLMGLSLFDIGLDADAALVAALVLPSFSVEGCSERMNWVCG